MLNLTIRYIWDENYDFDYYFPIHSHNFYEMAYYPSGSGLLKTDKGDYKIEENGYVIVPPGTAHSEKQFKDSKKICLAFYCDTKLPIMHGKDISHKIQRCLQDMSKESHNLKFNSDDYFSAKLCEMFVYIQRVEHPNIISLNNFEYIINLIEEKSNEKIPLATYAEQLNISYDYFRHKFKDITGYSPHEYIIIKRLEMASDMLTQSDFSCSEISEKCGFSDSAQFSKMFKQKYGVTPTKYRHIGF